jgi:hypothetical protein
MLNVDNLKVNGWHNSQYLLGLFTVPATGTAVISTGAQRANPSCFRPVMPSRKFSTGWDGRWNGRHGQRDGDESLTLYFCLENMW